MLGFVKVKKDVAQKALNSYKNALEAKFDIELKAAKMFYDDNYPDDGWLRKWHYKDCGPIEYAMCRGRKLNGDEKVQLLNNVYEYLNENEYIHLVMFQEVPDMEEAITSLLSVADTHIYVNYKLASFISYWKKPSFAIAEETSNEQKET